VSLFDGLKLIHMSCAFLSITGFALRGYWMFTDNPLLQRRLTRVLPHTIDSLLLASAVGMLIIWQVSPLQLAWLSAKIIALLLYIGLGMVALRFGRTRRTRMTAYVTALLIVGYIVSVAYTKSALGLLLVFLS
jgi:uncharacterized membrane protein SirB2